MSGKRICIDLRPLQIGHEKRGIGMFLISVLENLTNDDNEYIFYSFDGEDLISSLGIHLRLKSYQIVTTPRLKNEIKQASDVIDAIKIQCHKFKELRQYAPDVFIQFDFKLGTPSWKRVKKVLIAYDLIPLTFRSDYLPRPLDAFRLANGKKSKVKSFVRSIYYLFRTWLQYRQYNKADQIISISKSTTKSFIDLLGIDSGKICTIPLAPVTTNANSHAREFSFSKPFLFYIGGTDRRKRVDHIIKAFNIVRGRGYDMELVFAGNEFVIPEEIPDPETVNTYLASPYKDDIKLIGFVSDAEKNLIYEQAFSFVFCSLAEGFGLPVLESMANSCPVVAYNNSSIPEAAGDAALLAESGDYVAVAENVIKFFDKDTRETYIVKGIRQAKKFSWANFNKQLMKLIDT